MKKYFAVLLSLVALAILCGPATRCRRRPR